MEWYRIAGAVEVILLVLGITVNIVFPKLLLVGLALFIGCIALVIYTEIRMARRSR